MRTNNQTKCGIIYETIAMRGIDEERITNFERPKNYFLFLIAEFFQTLAFLEVLLHIYASRVEEQSVAP